MKIVDEKQPLIIHNWTEFGNTVIGSIYNDLRRTNPNNGSLQRTSIIKSINRDIGILETINTVYHLGMESVN